MKFPINGKILYNLTKCSLSHQIQNSLVYKLLSHNYSTGDQNSNSKQPNLLKYHVLPLEETMKRFKTTIEPLLTPEELEAQKEISDNFMRRDGQKLQDLLEEVGSNEKNWLAPRWLNVAYLKYRLPVTAYVSPGMTFPVQEFKDLHDYIDYTSRVIFGLGKFNELVHANKIPIVKMGKNELDNSQFGKVFGTCRIPKRIQDEIVYNPCSDYIVVIYKNHFYQLQIYDEEGKLIAAPCLAAQLEDIMLKETKLGIPYGILTTDTRDNWAESYGHLANTPRNREALKTIQTALFTVSLDECFAPKEGEEAEELILSLIHGKGSKVNSANRWMDKTIQLVVNPNGFVGFTYEHSPAEGQPIAMMMDFVVKMLKEDCSFGDCGSQNITPAKKIEFCPLTECVQQWLIIAQRNIDQLVRRLHMKVLKFDGYGKDFIKKQKLGPDSYIQMAIQLAFYKLHTIPAAQYESAHLRIFDGGRTETIRSCSIESLAFCKAMESEVGSIEERAEALREAVMCHQMYAKLALEGRGVDRHFFGLQQMAVENCLPIPEFFSSPGYVKSSDFTITTSQVATKYDAFMGYGPTEEDGYSCCYNPRECDIILAVAAWKHCPITDALKFVKMLEKSFLQMKDVLEKCPLSSGKPHEPKCKL